MISFFRKKELLPTPELLAEIKERMKHTPDILRLESYESQNVLICDNLMTSHPGFSRIAREGIVFCPAYTSEPMTMFKKKMGKETFPIILDNTSNLGQLKPWEGDAPFNHAVPKAPIQGELMAFPPYFFRDFLDIYYSNGYIFQRKRVKINVFYTEVTRSKVDGSIKSQKRIQQMPAWVYIGRSDYWSALIDCGYDYKLVRRYKFEPSKNNSRSYYFFDKQEYYDK